LQPIKNAAIKTTGKMNINKPTGYYMRILHRYIGFFLAGIMAVYAISGIILIFRDTDFLKKEIAIEKKVNPGGKEAELGKMLGIRELKVLKNEGDILYFKEGIYNSNTGVTNYTAKQLPFVLNKLTQLHKASSKKPLFFLNIFFGVSLLFFVISSFWMFMPKTRIFKKGIYFTVAGTALTLILLFI